MSGKTGIDLEYLILLRREIEGYFPKPPPLKAFDWLPEEEIRKLEEKGIRNAAGLLEATRGGNALNELAQSAGTNARVLEILIRLADLTRVQWVSPIAARMILEAGYSS